MTVGQSLQTAKPGVANPGSHHRPLSMKTLASADRSLPVSGLCRAAFDKTAAALGLILLIPVFIVAAIAVAVNDGFPVLFRHKRTGRWGRPFELLKFRSMRMGCAGAEITVDGDTRVTRVGRVLRQYKIDELPQLWNVLKGDMSLIGPRPLAPGCADQKDASWRRVLSVQPGVTDLASLVYRDEERLLATLGEPERYYREYILPDKLMLNLHYMNTRCFRKDLSLLFWSAWYSMFPAQFDSESIRRRFLPHAPLSEPTAETGKYFS